MALALSVAGSVRAADIKKYYANADRKKKVELKLALKGSIAKHTKLPYGNLWTYYEKVDYVYTRLGHTRYLWRWLLNHEDMQARFGADIPRAMLERAASPVMAPYCICDDSGIRLTRRGMLISNAIICELMEHL